MKRMGVKLRQVVREYKKAPIQGVTKPFPEEEIVCSMSVFESFFLG